MATMAHHLLAKTTTDEILNNFKTGSWTYGASGHGTNFLRTGTPADFPSPDAAFYDMSKQVIGVVCGRVDRISSWLGNGELLSQSSMFPPPCYDAGYDLLLSRANFFSELGVSIVKYV